MLPRLQQQHRRRRRLPSARSLAAVGFVALLAVVQSSIAPHFPILGVQLSLVLVAVILAATIGSGRRALWWGFLGGLGVDLFSAAPLGTNAVLFTLLAFALGAGGRRLAHTQPLIPLLAVSVAVAAYYPLVIAALGAHGFQIDWGTQVGARLLPGVAANVLAGLILYPFVRILAGGTRRGPAVRFKAVQ